MSSNLRGGTLFLHAMLDSRLGNVQQGVQMDYEVLIAEFIDHGVSHLDSFAKNAVTFFKILRFILAMASSRSNS